VTPLSKLKALAEGATEPTGYAQDTVTPSTLAALKALAEGATQGVPTWKSYAVEMVEATDGEHIGYTARGHVYGHDGSDDGHEEAHRLAKADARYIAAASPSMVLALVAEVERLREALASVETWTHEYGAALKPTRADTFGDGMREAKAQVGRLLRSEP